MRGGGYIGKEPKNAQMTSYIKLSWLRARKNKYASEIHEQKRNPLTA